MTVFDFLSGASGIISIPGAIVGLPTAVILLSKSLRRLLENNRWTYPAIAVMYLIVFGIGVAARLDYFEQPLQQISNRAYRNETVLLDGRFFYNCTFNNVLFAYNGGKVEISGGSIVNTKGIVSPRSDVINIMNVVNGLGFLNKNFFYNEVPESEIMKGVNNP